MAILPDIDGQAPQEPQPKSLALQLLEQGAARRVMAPVPPAPTEPQDPDGKSLAVRLLERERDQRDRLVVDAFDRATKASPTLRGEAQQIAGQLGLDPDTAFRNIEQVRAINAVRRVRQIRDAGNSPILTRMLEDPEFAAVAWDAAHELSLIELLRGNFEAGRLMVARGDIGQRGLLGSLGPSERQRLAAIDARMAELPRSSGGFLGGLSRTIGQWSAQAPQILKGATMGLAAGGGAGFVYGGEGPQAALTVPIGAVTGMGAGAISAMAASSFAAEGGNAYLDMIAKGYDEPAARGAGWAVGIVNAALEMVGGGAIARGAGVSWQAIRSTLGRDVGSQVAEALTRPTRSIAFGRLLRSYAEGLGTETATETLQQISQVLGDEAARAQSGLPLRMSTPEGRSEILEELSTTVVETIYQTGLIALPLPAGRFIHDVGRAREAQRSQAAIRELGRLSANNPVRARNPEALEGFVGDVVRDTPVENLYVDGAAAREVLRQSGVPPSQVDDLVPGLGQRIDEAAATGGDVVIPTEQFASKLAGTPVGDRLFQSSRTSVDGMSPDEEARFREALPQFVTETERAIEQRRLADLTFAESGRAVEERLLGDIGKSVAMRRSQAFASARFYRAFAETMAGRLGITPEQFDQRHGLKIASEARSTEEHRAEYLPGQGVIRLLQDADASSFIHEAAHYFLDVYERVVGQAAAPQLMVDDFGTLLQSFGVQDLAAWRALAPQERVKRHEQFALQFEKYVSEGKGPSAKLQRLFETVGRWITKVYRSMVEGKLSALYRQDFGEDLPALSDEVRAVMGRMLAAEDEIESAIATRNLVPLFQNLEESGMTPEQWAAYQQIAEESKDAAVADARAASVRQLQWLSGARSRMLQEMQSKARKERARVRREVERAVDESPLRRAILFLRTGRYTDTDGVEQRIDGPHRLDRAAALAALPERLRGEGAAKLRAVSADRGMPIDVAAGLLGYESGERLVLDIATAPTVFDEVRARTDQRMLEEHGELVDQAQRERAIDRALHGEARARFVGVELRALQRSVQPVREMVAAARIAARRHLEGKKLQEVRVRLFAEAARRANRDAAAAMRKGDTRGAIEAKRRELFHTELTSAAAAIRDEVDRRKREWKRVWRDDKDLAKTRNVDFIAAARAVLAYYGQSPRTGDPLDEIKKVREYNPDVYERLVPLISGATQAARPLEELTVREFRDVADAIESLDFLGRRELVFENGTKREAVAEIASAAVQKLLDLGLPKKVPGQTETEGWLDKRMRDLVSGVATATRIEHLFSYLDGGKAGPWTKLFRRVKDSLTSYRKKRKVWMQRYADLVAQVTDDLGRVESPAVREDQVREVGYTFKNRWELLGALLHAGNLSNLRKLLVGREWGDGFENGGFDRTRWDAFVDRMVLEGKLTQRDFDWAQSVWDLLEELKPELQRVHRELHGYYFTEVEAKGFTIVFPDGSAKSYRGGYVPAKPDHFTVQSARIYDQIAELEQDHRRSLPIVPHGFTKERDDSARRLSIDVRRIEGHIDTVLRFIEVQPALRDVARVTRNWELSKALERFDPTLFEKAISPWLMTAARGSMVEPGKSEWVDRFFSLLKRNVGLSVMAGYAVNAFQNTTGLFIATAKVPGRHVWTAFWDWLWSPRNQVANDIAAASEFMAQRMDKGMHELTDKIRGAIENRGRVGKMAQWAREQSYFLQWFTQKPTDLIVWKAAYNHSLEQQGATPDHETAHKEAVAHADSVVRLTQAGNDPEDSSAYEVGTPLWRAIIQFQSWANNYGNLHLYESKRILRTLGWKGGAREIASLVFWAHVVPTIIAGGIQKGLSGGWDDEDDNGSKLDDYAEWLFGVNLKGTLQPIPFFGQAATTAWNFLGDGNRFNDRMPTLPAWSTLERGMQAISAATHGKEVSGSKIRDVLGLATALTGIPTFGIDRPISYGLDVASDRVQPSGTLDLLRGLLTGTASKGSRQ